jgi:hypothetical protein
MFNALGVCFVFVGIFLIDLFIKSLVALLICGGFYIAEIYAFGVTDFDLKKHFVVFLAILWVKSLLFPRRVK